MSSKIVRSLFWALRFFQGSDCYCTVHADNFCFSSVPACSKVTTDLCSGHLQAEHCVRTVSPAQKTRGHNIEQLNTIHDDGCVVENPSMKVVAVNPAYVAIR